MATFKSILRNSFIKQFDSEIPSATIIYVLLFCALLSLFVFFVYRLTCKKAFYSKSFAISLVVVSMITSIIILAIQSSIVISLGMVGALSIVRFRTAIKNPMDLAFLFWSISIGIICGAGIYEVAVIGTIVIAVVMLLLHFVPNVKPELLLIVNANDSEAEAAILEKVKDKSSHYIVKSRNIKADSLDMIIEVKTDDEALLVKEVSKLEKVYSAVLMMHDGDVVV